MAPIGPNSYNPDTHTVDAVLSSGAEVRRLFFNEQLEISAGAVDLSRAVAGLVPLLAVHNQFDIGAVLGSISNVRISAGQLLGTLTFGQTDQARQAEGMVARGELRGVSVGYNVNTWEIQSRPDDGSAETWLATNWELLEVSLVPVPADALSGIRSETPFEIRDEDHDMLTRNNPRTPAPTQPAPSSDISRFTPTQALDFISLARDFGVETRACELVGQNERGEIGTEAAREALLRAAGERQRADTAPVRADLAPDHSSRTFDNPQFLARAVEDAIFARISGTAPSEAARDLAGMSMVQLASECLARSGVRDVHRMSPQKIIGAAWQTRSGAPMVTGDFPNLLTSAGNRYLLNRFAVAASALKSLSVQRSAADFRTLHAIQLSGFGSLSENKESSEIKTRTFKERAETYSVKKYADKFGLSLEAIVNDDLGAFAQAFNLMGMACASTEADLFALLINSNPVLSDNVATFHATHGNLAGSGTAPSVATMDSGRQAMRAQKDLDGTTPLSAAPAFIVASPLRETAIEQLLVATINPTQADDTNPFHGKLTPLIDQRIAAEPWYLFADPNLAPVIEHAYLNGHDGPVVEQKPSWDTLGQEFRVHMIFGAGVVDYRGAYKNPGV